MIVAAQWYEQRCFYRGCPRSECTFCRADSREGRFWRRLFAQIAAAGEPPQPAMRVQMIGDSWQRGYVHGVTFVGPFVAAAGEP